MAQGFRDFLRRRELRCRKKCRKTLEWPQSLQTSGFGGTLYKNRGEFGLDLQLNYTPLRLYIYLQLLGGQGIAVS